MNRVIVKSVHGAFDYVMEHYYPYGMAAEAAEQGALTDTYAVISIQDSHTGGFGVTFAENQFCKGVLTLYFDDIVTEVDGADQLDLLLLLSLQLNCNTGRCCSATFFLNCLTPIVILQKY